MASFPEGENMGTCGWVIWHLRENPSPEWRAMFKISMANLHMAIKRRLQDKNIWGSPCPLDGPLLPPHKQLIRQESIPEKNCNKIWKECRMFFICYTVRVRTKSTLFRMLSLTFIHRKAGEVLWRKGVVRAPQGRFFCAQQAEEMLTLGKH